MEKSEVFLSTAELPTDGQHLLPAMQVHQLGCSSLGEFPDDWSPDDITWNRRTALTEPCQPTKLLLLIKCLLFSAIRFWRSVAQWWLEHSPSGPWVSGTELSLFSSPASEGYTCNIICLKEKCFLCSVFLAENLQLKKIPKQIISTLLPDHSTKKLMCK